MHYKKLAVTLACAAATVTGIAPAASAASTPSATAAKPSPQAAEAAPQVAVRNPYRQYRSRSTGKCLDTRRATGNASVRLVRCHPNGHVDIRHQLWAPQNDGTFRSKVNNKCLDVYGTVAVVMRNCNTGRNQQWRATATVTGRLKNVGKNKCMSTYPGSIYLRVDRCGAGGNKQLWSRF